MSDTETRFPSVRDAFIILGITFSVYFFGELFWGSVESKGKILILESLIIFPALIFARMKQLSFRNVFRWRAVDTRVLLVSGLIGVGLSVITDEIDRVIQGFVPMPENLLDGLQALLIYRSTFELMLLVLTVVFAAGFFEEMLFRGFLQGALESTGGAVKGIVVTACVFTFLHFNPWWLLEIFLLGVILSVLARRSNSIFPGVVVHGVNNALSIILINADPTKLKWYLSGDHISLDWIVAGIGFVVIGFYFFYRFTERRQS